MSGIDDFLTPAQRQAGEWMRPSRTGPQWGDDPPSCEDELDRAYDLLRDVLVDYVPWCTRPDGACECSANRARRFLRAAGVDL